MSKKKTQKIIIPKGTINPNEDTLIEIPTELQEQPLVVAKKDGYKEKNVSIETTSKNTVYEGNKYSILEDSNRVNIVDTRGSRSFAPRRMLTAREAPTPPVFPHNETGFEEDSVVGRKLEDLLRAQKELQETGSLLAAKPLNLSNVSCQICPASSDVSTKRTCSALSNTDEVPRGTSVRRRSKTFSSSDVPPFTSTKRGEVQVSRSLPAREGVGAEAEGEKEEERRISFKVDRETSDVCLENLRPKSNSPRPLQDKEVQSSPRNLEEMGSEDLMSPRRRRSKDRCKKCKRESLAGPDSATSWREDKLMKFDKSSSSEIDDIYIEQLKRQFEDAKRKLDDAVALASLSLKRLSDKRYAATSGASSGASICDSVPERDVSFVPLCGGYKESYVVFVPSSTGGEPPKKVPSYDFTPSDTFDRNDIHKNIVTRRATDAPRKSPVQNASDSPCSFLKPPKPDPHINKDSTTREKRQAPKGESPRRDLYPPKKPVLKEQVVQTDKTALPTPPLAKCSCGKIKDSGSIKFVKEPRSNFSTGSHSASGVDRGPTFV